MGDDGEESARVDMVLDSANQAHGASGASQRSLLPPSQPAVAVLRINHPRVHMVLLLVATKNPLFFLKETLRHVSLLQLQQLPALLCPTALVHWQCGTLTHCTN